MAVPLKPKFFCNIGIFLAEYDPLLHSALSVTCTLSALGLRSGKAGITFLRPNKATVEKIATMVQSSDQSAMDKARDMLLSCIIKIPLKTAKDWKENRDHIPNSQFPSRLTAIADVTEKEVKFVGGAKAKINADFKDGSNEGVLAVWDLDGELPIDGKEAPKNAKVKAKKTGAYEIGNMMDTTQRNKIILAIENAYGYHELQRRSDPSVVRRDIYLEYLTSFIQFVANEDMTLLRERVLPLVSFGKIDLYFLLEPHRDGGGYLIDDSIVGRWWAQHKLAAANCKQVVQQVAGWLSGGDGEAAIYSNRAKLLPAIAGEMHSLLDQVESSQRTAASSIDGFYKKMIEENKIGDVENVWPAGLLAHYRANPGLKLTEDELRFVAHGAFAVMESDRSFDFPTLNALLNTIGDYLHASSLETRAKSRRLVTPALMQMISPQQHIDEIRCFIMSTSFCFVPLTEEDCINMPYKNTTRKPAADDLIIYNQAKHVFDHQRILQSKADSQLLQVIQSFDVDTLDAGVREALKRKFA